MNAEHLEKVVELIIKEIKILLKEGLSKDELENPKNSLREAIYSDLRVPAAE